MASIASVASWGTEGSDPERGGRASASHIDGIPPAPLLQMHPHVMLTEEELRAQQDASAESDMSLFEDIDMGRRGRQCGFLNGTAASYVSQLGLSVSAADPASEYQSRPPPEPYPQVRQVQQSESRLWSKCLVVRVASHGQSGHCASL
mgnify:CR=1 FL=1